MAITSIETYRQTGFERDSEAGCPGRTLRPGRLDAAQLAAEVRKAERALRREINCTVLTPRELKRRLAKGDAFVADVWNGKRVQLIGNEDDQTAAGALAPSEAVPG